MGCGVATKLYSMKDRATQVQYNHFIVIIRLSSMKIWFSKKAFFIFCFICWAFITCAGQGVKLPFLTEDIDDLMFKHSDSHKVCRESQHKTESSDNNIAGCPIPCQDSLRWGVGGGGWWLVHRCCCRAVRLHYKHINYTIVTHSWIKILSSLLRSIRCCVPVLCCMSRICLSYPLLACAMMEKEISKPLTV